MILQMLVKKSFDFTDLLSEEFEPGWFRALVQAAQGEYGTVMNQVAGAGGFLVYDPPLFGLIVPVLGFSFAGLQACVNFWSKASIGEQVPLVIEEFFLGWSRMAPAMEGIQEQSPYPKVGLHIIAE